MMMTISSVTLSKTIDAHVREPFPQRCHRYLRIYPLCWLVTECLLHLTLLWSWCLVCDRLCSCDLWVVIGTCCGLNLPVTTLDFFPCTAPCTHTHTHTHTQKHTPTIYNTVTGPSRAFRGIAERKRRKREQEATALMERYCPNKYCP